MPRFSCSTSRTSGKRPRTSSRLPSVDPWSTTTVSRPRTDSRHCSSQGSAFQLTTTTETSVPSLAIGDGRAPHALPEDHHEPGERQHERQQEEQEARRKGGVGIDVEAPEEVDEERLA